MDRTRTFRHKVRKLRFLLPNPNAKRETDPFIAYDSIYPIPLAEVISQTLEELDVATESLHATLKDFISMTFNENLMKSLRDLRKRLSTVSRFCSFTKTIQKVKSLKSYEKLWNESVSRLIFMKCWPRDNSVTWYRLDDLAKRRDMIQSDLADSFVSLRGYFKEFIDEGQNTTINY